MDVAQLVRAQLSKVGVTSSNLVIQYGLFYFCPMDVKQKGVVLYERTKI